MSNGQGRSNRGNLGGGGGGGGGPQGRGGFNGGFNRNGGNRGRGGFVPGRPNNAKKDTLKFESEYDFEQANEEFKEVLSKLQVSLFSI